MPVNTRIGRLNGRIADAILFTFAAWRTIVGEAYGAGVHAQKTCDRRLGVRAASPSGKVGYRRRHGEQNPKAGCSPNFEIVKYAAQI